MSLVIYRTKEEVPDGFEVIEDNDEFFDYATTLDPSSDVQNLIVSKIDEGKIVSAQTFIGRTPEFGTLFKNNLSTGSKTLLNIINHKDICFDCVECGYNAIALLPYLTDGYAIVRNLLVPVDKDIKCDIIYDDRKFNSFFEVLKYDRNKESQIE